MSKQQPFISIKFGSEWIIRRPFLYRYMEKEYVDTFFETGALRLSSFKRFSEHPDEERLDAREGEGTVFNINTEGEGQTFSAKIRQGHNAYVLSTSTLYSKKLAERFETDSGFRIDNVMGFAIAVSRYVPGFIGGLEGPCIYQNGRIIERHSDPINLDSMRVSSGSKEIDMSKLMYKADLLAGFDLFFLKEIRYAHQHEYRLLWLVNNQADLYLDIICPEARDFCTRFEDLRIG